MKRQRICTGVLLLLLLLMPGIAARAEEVDVAETGIEEQEPENNSVEQISEALIEDISENNSWIGDNSGYEYQEENNFAAYSAQITYTHNISDAADLLRQEMMCRNGKISIYYQGEYVSGMSKDILEAAIAYDDSLPSTAGDYLRYHYNRVIRRTYKGSNTDGEYYRFEYELYYLSSYEQEAALENRAAEILNELDVYSADRETQIRSVYAYIAQNVHYDNMIYDDFNVHSAYSAAIHGKAVCQGYSLLLYRLLHELGIKNRMIPGEASGISHVWNIVEMDGLWYNLDVTWDWGKSQNFQWFLKGRESFDITHFRDDAYKTEEFLEIYPMSDKDYGYIEEEPEESEHETGESESETEGVEKDERTLFIERLYELILGREPDKTGLESWKKALESGEAGVLDVIDGFFKSTEFLQRENAVSGMPDILNKMSGDTVLIENAPEEIQWNVLAFVYRQYSCALERQPDKNGLNEWYHWLLEGKETAESVAYGFIFSQEALGKNLSDEAYIKTLYHVLMGREYDVSGLRDWAAGLDNGMSRKEVFYGFVDSDEFKAVVEAYGL